MFIEIKQNQNENENITNKESELEKPGLSIKLNIPTRIKYSKELRAVIRKSNLLLLCAFIWILGMVFAETYFLYLIKEITDYAFVGNVKDITSKLTVSFILIGTVFLLTIINLFFKIIYLRFSINSIKSTAVKKIMSLESQQVKNRKESEYISLLTNNVKSIESDYFGTKYDIIYGVVYIIAGIILSVAIDWRILLVAGIIFVMIYLVISSIVSRVETQTENVLNALDKYTIRVREFIHGIRLIVSSNLAQHTKEEMYKEIDNVQENQAQLNKKVVNINIISQMLVSSVVFAFLGYTVYAVRNNIMSVGEIIFIISGFLFLLQPGMQILQCLPSLKAGNVALSEIDHDIFALSLKDGKEQCEQEEVIISGDSVTVSYDANVVLKDVNFSLKDHKKYLVVGTSGCGKSTFLKLLLREINPLKGQMKYGSIDYDSISTDSLLRNITCMPQQCIIFDDTIRNNICMYRNVSEQEYRKVLEKTQLTEFVESFAEKDDHILKDFGSNISGGEKARIALARTLLSRAKVLLLDEPFANLDIQNVKKIEEILLSIEDRCIVNVSHVINEENVNRYDLVLRVEDGNISAY